MTMPFVSQKQRAMFHAALKDPKVRKRLKLKLKDVQKMIGHDAGGKLPKKK